MNSEQIKNKNQEKISDIPHNSVFLGKDQNGYIMYQLGRFVVSYLHSSSEDLCGLEEKEIEKAKDEKVEKEKEVESN